MFCSNTILYAFRILPHARLCLSYPVEQSFLIASRVNRR
jgi:hypothetical protein